MRIEAIDEPTSPASAPPTEVNGADQNKVPELIDHLFRHQSGRMASVLVRLFGISRIDTAEEAVQDSLVAALRKWPFTGVPDNPIAWLIQTARNRMIDQIRRDRYEQLPDIEGDEPEDGRMAEPAFSSELNEDELRMIFACCHPTLSPDSQVALTLKIVSGFSVGEIASAFLSTSDSVAKMLVRAKSRLRSDRANFEIPAGAELKDRLDSVLKSLYLIFNEGFGASSGDDLVRHELCREAIRLTKLLASHPVTATPKVHAAAALFHFQAARLPARTDHTGELILFADQDRELWDRGLIADGLKHFSLSGQGDEISDFHLEAEIAASYTLSASFDSIDRPRILACYELLSKVSNSRVAELNRIIVVSQLSGAEEALRQLGELTGMTHYNLFHITKAHLLAASGSRAAARASFEDGLSRTKNEAVRRFVLKRIEDLREMGRGV